MPKSAFTSERRSIGYCGKSAKPSYSSVKIVVGKSLLGVALPNVAPRLGKLKPGKRERRPPLGLLGSPSSVKLTCDELKPSATSFGISMEAMIALCE